MLRLLRRHLQSCPHRSSRYRRCACPIHVYGTLGGEKIRKAMDQTSWEAATELVNAWTTSGQIGVVRPDVPTIATAIEKFTADAKAQHLSPETIRKYDNLLNRRFLLWCETRGYRELKQLTVEAIREFRRTWTDSPLYATKNLERLRAFFRYCQKDDWIKKNPALDVKSPRLHEQPTLPFSDDEMTQILEACDRYPGNKDRMKAFVLTMRYSGLRIGDTIALTTSRVKGDKLKLRTEKTGTHVYVPLPPVVTDALGKLEPHARSGRYFSTGNAKPQTARANWSRYLESVFELADVKDGHSHRFRDTFAVSLLEKGVSIETVSMLLGHSSLKITEKHYKPWVKSLQEKLESAVRQTWTPSQDNTGNREHPA
jgi:integrase/recombinase XerD